MKTILKIFSIGVLVSIYALSGCSPAVVATQPEAPVAVVPASPGPDYVWVNGSWRYNRPQRVYVYREGYWVRPTRANRQWVDGHWVQTRRGWHYVEGHWR
jgi:hypothetical protein